MAVVEASTVIHVPLEIVYRVAKDVEAFPSFMPDVETVRVLERRNSHTVTEWVGVVQGRKVRWIEEDEWDDARHGCRFRQREGDFTKYEGTWSFAATDGGTAVNLVLEFQLDLPLAGALLSNLVRVLVRKNMESMLAALKSRLEGSPAGHASTLGAGKPGTTPPQVR